MAGVSGQQHVEQFRAADLTDDDAVGPHPQRLAHQFPKRDLARPFDIGRTRLQPHDVGMVDGQLCGVLDDENPLSRIGAGEQAPRAASSCPCPPRRR